MKTNKDIYKELSKKYTDEELVDGFVFNEVLEDREQREAEEEFRKLRAERLKKMTSHEILVSNVLQMKYLLQAYFKADNYDSTYSFSNQLRNYISITKRSNKEIAGNLDIHPTKLSRILNGKENPNIELMYRLGRHSDGELPAYYWWRLYSQELENKIKKDLEKKMEESRKVKDHLDIRA